MEDTGSNSAQCHLSCPLPTSYPSHFLSLSFTNLSIKGIKTTKTKPLLCPGGYTVTGLPHVLHDQLSLWVTPFPHVLLGLEVDLVLRGEDAAHVAVGTERDHA